LEAGAAQHPALELPAITPLGRLAVAGQGLFVLVLALAVLEWRGVRQPRIIAARA
jgi:hypothetical protein